MAKLSDIVIGFIMVGAIALVLLSFIGTFTSQYGVTTAQLYNDTGDRCSGSYTKRALISISALYQNETVDSGTYAPGQINAPVGSSMVTSTQSSGLITTLKTAVAPLTLTKALMGDMGCAMGIPSQLILTFQIVFSITVLLLIAGIFYFRPI